MAREKLSAEEAITEFWDHLKNRSTVMLGIQGISEHTQPMTTFSEPENGLIWFFTRDDTDLAKDAVQNVDGRMIFASKDEEVYADVTGVLTVELDRGRIDKYWNPVVAAWYPGGKDDPHLTMLKFQPKDGQVWVSKQGLLRFAFQVTKANVAKTMPDLGGTAEVAFKG